MSQHLDQPCKDAPVDLRDLVVGDVEPEDIPQLREVVRLQLPQRVVAQVQVLQSVGLRPEAVPGDGRQVVPVQREALQLPEVVEDAAVQGVQAGVGDFQILSTSLI